MCFGTLTMGPLQARLPLEEGAGIIARAIGLGVNFFDTAQLYGTYDYLKKGMVLANNREIVISSKTYAWDKKGAVEAVEQARKELNRDYIDIFMLHEQESSHTLRGHREALDTLYDYKQRGILRAVGISTHHVEAVDAATNLGLDIIHPLINLHGLGIADGSREEMEQALIRAHDKGIGIFSMKSLGGGNLFKQAEECLRYALELSFVDSVAIGVQSISELETDISFWENGCFSDSDIATLSKKIRRLHIDSWCEGCGTCVEKCTQKALVMSEKKAVCLHQKCVLCGYCSAACPMWAIKVV